VTAVTGSVHQDQRDRFPAAGSLLREVRKAGRLRATVTFDLVLLLALLLLTALFGRPFSRIGLDSVRLYITELAIALIACAALLRCGIREAYARIRAVVPVVVLLAYWGIGAIAALRGISTFGLRRTTQDIGLVEYSIFVPLVAVVVDTPAKERILVRGLPWLGALATAVFAVVFFVAPYGRLGIFHNPASASGIYLALVSIPVTAALAYGARVNVVLLAASVAALVLMSLTATRSIVVALAAALVAIVLFGRGSRRRALAVVTCAGVLSVGGAGALHAANIGVRAALPVAPPPQVPVEADDGISLAVGGTVSRTDSVTGTQSRELARGALLEIPRIGGLDVGERYTIAFSVKPLVPTVTSGQVGDTSGRGWGAANWKTAAAARWQRFQFSLVASSDTERVVVWARSGSPRIRVDALSVRRTRPGDGSIAVAPNPSAGGAERPAVPETTIGEAFTKTFDPRDTTGENANARWRLAYWKFVISETAHSPIFGVGFGHAANFRWEGILYDARVGDPTDPNDITPPHNSFLNVLYRTGFLGFALLLALAVITMRRAWQWLARSSTRIERHRIVGLVSLFVFVSVTASFNVALESPYMGMFFWTIMALLLIVTRDQTRVARDRPTSSDG
jgi:O-antigen ligase/polysaccharide polymerase Wzy-like membrane protein